MKNKLDKAIKEEQERFEKEFTMNTDGSFSYIDSMGMVDGAVEMNDLTKWLKESYKRIAKVALEASKLKKSMYTGLYSGQGYNQAVQDQHEAIEKLLNEKQK